MSTSERDSAFVVWLTGLPASGKSTLCAALCRELQAAGVRPAVLESDALRRVLTPDPRYDEQERQLFYRALVVMAQQLSAHGVPVILDATANRRAYRDLARRLLPDLVEVFVDCPQAVCAARDPKGLYRRARAGQSSTLPGLQAPYEPPERPEVVVRSDRESPEQGARRILAALRERGLAPAGRPPAYLNRLDGLDGDDAALARRPLDHAVPGHLQGQAEYVAGVARVDHVVDEAPAGDLQDVDVALQH
jgi:adenylylsulfate kinase